MEAAGKQDAQKSGLRAARAYQEHSNEVLLGELGPTAMQTAAIDQSDLALEAPGRSTKSRMTWRVPRATVRCECDEARTCGAFSTPFG